MGYIVLGEREMGYIERWVREMGYIVLGEREMGYIERWVRDGIYSVG